jgi:hypothetical protein
MTRFACSAAFALLLLALPATASAYWPYYGYGFGGHPAGFGGGYYTNMYYQYDRGYVPPPPYFSVYPPVYYSPHITMRHYGASPYAWPAGFSPASFVGISNAARRPEPLMVMNPYVEGAAEAAPAAEQASATKPKASNPLRIDNPYVAGGPEAKPAMIDNPFVVKASR